MKIVTLSTKTYLAATLTLATLGMAIGVSTATAQASASAASQTNLNAELKSPLDSKHAQVGQQVLAATTGKAMLGETSLPKGTQLLGHVTSVSQYAKGGGQGEVGMLFDQARLRDGKTLPIRSSLRSIAPPAGAQGSTQSSTQADVSGNGGSRGNGGVSAQSNTSARASSGGLLGGTTSAVGGLAGGVANTTRGVVGGVANTGGAVVGTVAHTTTGLVAGVSSIPGVVLSSGVDAKTSGVVAAAGRDVKLDTGTQLALGVTVQ